MAQWNNYWRIVSPTSHKKSYAHGTVNVDDLIDTNTAGYSAFQTVNWFTNLLKGAASRMQRYKQYDAMDNSLIARSLDIIAEEMTNLDQKTKLPFLIEYQTDDSSEISDATSVTLKAALRYWCNFHNFKNRIFNLSRTMIKYGDVIYKKTSDTKQWEFIDLTRVIGIEINEEKLPVKYHIRPSNFQQNNKFGKKEEVVEVVPVEAIIHFSLANETLEDAPFGLSILQAAFKDWQKLTMLEDASIIYRIVRAPERRAFYIDTGNTPPQRVAEVLEKAKNSIRQRRVPSVNESGGVDSVYDPESMGTDYFFSVNAAGKGTRVETVQSNANWEIPELDYFSNKVYQSLRVPTSYMKGPEAQGAQVQDGKVGIAYIEELRFANFVQHLQARLEEVFDQEFKTYIKVTGLNVDTDSFFLRMPAPQNFAIYRQNQLNTELINAFKAIEDVKYLSRRFILTQYLGLSEDDLKANETMIKEERNIKATGVSEIQQIYDPAVYENREAINALPEPEDEPEKEEKPETK